MSLCDIINVEQNTPQWLAERAGVTTASNFAMVCKEVGGLNDQQNKYVSAVLGGATEKAAAADAGYKAIPRSDLITRALNGEVTTDFSGEAYKYAAKLAIERVSGKSWGEEVSAWALNRGKELEVAARFLYESQSDFMVTTSGLIRTTDGLFGCSLDGMVGEEGNLEIKCPVDPEKILHILGGGDVDCHMHQMQGGMWLTGRKWCDLAVFVPDLKPIGRDLYIRRIPRDDDFIERMVARLWRFEEIVSAKTIRLKSCH